MGGLPEGIVPGKTGAVVDEVSPQALTRALDQLLADPLKLSEMSAHAASNAATAFRWETVVEKILSVCEPSRGSTVRRVPIELKSPELYMKTATGVGGGEVN
jgi:glycosyltransferase involved in cell wall biosynthesis